jgi:predicted alpha/beta hydrolase
VGGEDLPRGVALEWSRWSRDPRYLQPTAEARGARGYGAYAGPWRALCITDDWYAPQRAVEALLTYYPRARSELRLVAPREVGARAIGHFGFFRPRFKDTLWRDARAWLEEQAA